MSEALQQVGADPIPEPDEELIIRPEEMGEVPETTGENNESLPMDPAANLEESTGEGSGDEGSGGEGPKERVAEPEEKEETPEPEPEPMATGTNEHLIPKARLDKALRDKRALEQQLQALQQQPNPDAPPIENRPVASAADLPSSKDIAEALLDGDLDKYAELMEQRDAVREQQLLAQVQQTVPLQVSQQQQKAQFDQVKTELETQYPLLDSNSDQFDQEVTETVVDMALSYSRRGYTHADALQAAADKVLRYERPELFQAAPTTVDNPKAAKVKQERMNIDQKLAAAAAQPPRVASMEVENPDTIPDFSAMSDEEFDKYTPQQIEEMMARMREQRMS